MFMGKFQAFPRKFPTLKLHKRRTKYICLHSCSPCTRGPGTRKLSLSQRRARKGISARTKFLAWLRRFAVLEVVTSCGGNWNSFWELSGKGEVWIAFHGMQDAAGYHNPKMVYEKQVMLSSHITLVCTVECGACNNIATCRDLFMQGTVYSGSCFHFFFCFEFIQDEEFLPVFFVFSLLEKKSCNLC